MKRQFLVAGSTFLAALTAGCVELYPSVLLQQLKSNGTLIEIDIENQSWIGSAHGLAGTLAFLTLILAECKGRRIAYILTCISFIIGWLTIFSAKNITTLIIGEAFNGFGCISILPVSFIALSEMVEPKYRPVCLTVYCLLDVTGLSVVGILGTYLDFRTICLIMICPSALAALIGFFWPESPPWLATNGKLKESKQAYSKLRGLNEESEKEWKQLMNAYKEKLDTPTKWSWKEFVQTITSRSFYLPTLHAIVLINPVYWGGVTPLLIYYGDISLQLAGKHIGYMQLIVDVSLVVGYAIATVVVRYYSSKRFMLFGMSTSSICLVAASIVAYLQSTSVIGPSELGVGLVVGYTMLSSLGTSGIAFSIANEIIPVIHRGISSCVSLIFSSIFLATSLKAFPYLCLYLNLWATLLIYAVYSLLSVVAIGLYVPETRNRTLYEIEEYYTYGRHKVAKSNDGCDPVNVPFVK